MYSAILDDYFQTPFLEEFNQFYHLNFSICPGKKRFFLRNWDSSLVKNSRAEIYSLPDDVIHSISDNFKSTLVCRAIYQSAGKYEVSNKSITFLAVCTFQLSNSLAITVGLLTLPYFEATHQLKQVCLLVLLFQHITS